MVDIATLFAWFVLALLFAVGVGLIVWLGSLPGKLAVQRNHPQINAINALSWFGLLFGGVGWVVAFVWSLLRSGPLGYDGKIDQNAVTPMNTVERDRIERLNAEVERLRAKVSELEQQYSQLRKPGK